MKRSFRVSKVVFHPSTLAVFSGLLGAVIGFLLNLASGGRTSQLIWIALIFAILFSLSITAWQMYTQEQTGKQWMMMLQEMVFQTYFLTVLADKPEISQIAQQRLGQVLKPLAGEQQVSMLKFFSHNGLSATFIGDALQGSSGLIGADLQQIELPQIHLEQANLSRVNFREANLREANLSETILYRADLSGANLSQARLNRTDLRGVNLRGANLTGADLSQSRMAMEKAARDASSLLQVGAVRYPVLRANLSHALLSGARLRDANLTGADLNGANLQGVDLTRANLSYANLQGVDLTRAVLTGVALIGANLQGADLTGATLTGAILDEADVRAAKVTEEQLQAVLSGRNVKREL
ncbi:MAG TPA: pentapeptide repeat-containing protein [Ktedonobacteraceae bacterium]|nr:pentapeptide repeat-containing protein [Ktedonobacteraceae bacterium]HZU68731.1 pentapeptide repeat-containing protein [Ktedonobacteraceae bacterium]